jgi:glycosyltransferase involved in cell wall biosynthesis
VTAAIYARFEAAGIASVRVNTASRPVSGSEVAAIVPRLGALCRLMLLLVSARPSTVYIALSGGNGQFFDILAVLAARARRCRIVFHHHNYSYLDRPRAMTRWLISAGGREATHIALCDQMANALRQRYPRVAHLVVISNAVFVGLNTAAPIVDERAGGLRTIGFLSNIMIDKGIERFVAFASLIRKFAPQAAAQVAGPIAEPNAGSVIERAVAEQTIAYRGAVYGADKDAFLDQIDTLIFPSIYPNECEPLVILEALRAGVPVIATARGCIPSMIDQSCGLLIDRDARNLVPAAERIENWMLHPAEFAAASKAARLKFERHYRDGEQALQRLIHGILANEAIASHAAQDA